MRTRLTSFWRFQCVLEVQPSFGQAALPPRQKRLLRFTCPFSLFRTYLYLLFLPWLLFLSLYCFFCR